MELTLLELIKEVKHGLAFLESLHNTLVYLVVLDTWKVYWFGLQVGLAGRVGCFEGSTTLFVWAALLGNVDNRYLVRLLFVVLLTITFRLVLLFVVLVVVVLLGVLLWLIVVLLFVVLFLLLRGLLTIVGLLGFKHFLFLQLFLLFINLVLVLIHKLFFEGLVASSSLMGLLFDLWMGLTILLCLLVEEIVKLLR